MILNILVVLVALVGIFLVIAALQPADFRVERSAVISAPPAAVFAQVNDFHKWEAWSPWAKLDPAAKNTFDGAPAGTGAGFAWDGNNKVGAGRMTLTESRPNELIRIKMNFVRPFESTSDVEFGFKPDGNQTRVTWTMSGRKNLMSKAFCMFVSMDKMVGGDFEKGLASIKSIAESSTRQ